MAPTTIDEELARRKKNGVYLASRFPDLARCADYEAFLWALEDVGLGELDFITSSEMWDALKKENV